MKIIDCRLRPPIKEYLRPEEHLFDAEDPFVLRYYKMTGYPIPDSVKERSLEKCFAEMDEAGIELALTCARSSTPNDTVVGLQEEYHDRFRCVAAFDPLKPAEGLEVIDKYVVNGPLAGLAVEAHYMHYDDERLFPIYEKMEQTGKFVMITSGGMGQHLEMTKPEYVDRVVTSFPKLNIINSHGGWPWVEAHCWIAFGRANYYLMPDLYLSHAPGYQMFVDAINYQLQDKMIYGSAYPYNNMVYAAKWAMKMVRAEVQEKYLYQNAAKLLGLE